MTGADVTIRPERPRDAGAIHAVVTSAFGQPDEAELVEALRRSDAWLSGMSLVAEVDGAVVGHVLLSRAHVGDHPVVALAPVAVRPDMQGRHIGVALVHAGIDAAREAGEDLIVLLGDPGFYGRFGFLPARWSGVRGPFGTTDAFQVMPLTGTRVRGEMRYPAPFDALGPGP